MPWNKPKSTQLELLDADPVDPDRAGPYIETASSKAWTSSTRATHASHTQRADSAAFANSGKPLLVALDRLMEDPNNPRTEFPEPEIVELIADIALRGVLQPIVVHPADAAGRYRVHFGTKRLRAALRAGLSEVPVVVRDAPSNPYAQVAENQKRHGLSPLDMARFIRSRVDAGDSNTAIAKELGMNLTTVAHHLSLLELPSELDDALQSGRCTSPRALHELSKLHDEQPEQVRALIANDEPITRAALSALRTKTKGVDRVPDVKPFDTLIRRAHVACERLERTLDRIPPAGATDIVAADLNVLHQRVIGLADRWLEGSDRQTPLHTGG
ncbi:MAG: ParB/RepB/Spo0J family partition protein [Burkholderiaceae bacterium]